MEYVSVIAGEIFSPEPKCTEPAVMLVAGLVNDLVSESSRDVLVQLAPQLVSARVAGQVLTSQVVVAVVAEALRLGGPDRRLGWYQRRAIARLSSRRAKHRPRFAAQIAERAYRQGEARHALAGAVAHVLRLPPLERDAALRSLLEAAIGAVTTADGWATRKMKWKSPHELSLLRRSRHDVSP